MAMWKNGGSGTRELGRRGLRSVQGVVVELSIDSSRLGIRYLTELGKARVGGRLDATLGHRVQS